MSSLLRIIVVLLSISNLYALSTAAAQRTTLHRNDIRSWNPFRGKPELGSFASHSDEIKSEFPSTNSLSSDIAVGSESPVICSTSCQDSATASSQQLEQNSANGTTFTASELNNPELSRRSRDFGDAIFGGRFGFSSARTKTVTYDLYNATMGVPVHGYVDPSTGNIDYIPAVCACEHGKRCGCDDRLARTAEELPSGSRSIREIQGVTELFIDATGKKSVSSSAADLVVSRVQYVWRLVVYIILYL